jgi:class 3 adenylate cyclase
VPVVTRREFHYRWEWPLEASPAALWPLVADTNRFNFETGAPRVEQVSAGEGGLRRMRLRVLGREVEYEEEPFEWVAPERFGVVRRFGGGPIAELVAGLELRPRADGGSLLTYDVRATPRNAVGQAIIPITIGRVARARMEETFRRYDRAAVAEVTPAPAAAPSFAPSGRERIEALRLRLAGSGAGPQLVGRLVDTVLEQDDLEVGRLRPYALADAWGAERRDVLELCLHATRAGLLESRWEIVCPLCRGAAASTGSLAGLEPSTHCDRCRIDVRASFEQAVELTFRPSPAVREVASVDYCVGGPGVTPHVVAQQLLAPGESRTLRLPLAPGAYRLRVLGAPGSTRVVAAAADERVEVSFVNEESSERLVLLERTAWSDQAATAADVTSLQAFRDLFAAEALRPGEEMAVGSLTVLFTDLRDSTRLYREIGDAPAYGSVVTHFDVLRDVIAREGGALVKTIGDAVMAVFRRPVSSLRAVLDAQSLLASPPNGARPLFLKAGVHSGPCIAVTLNDRLDYFGSTVNAAARIVGLSNGEDVVLSGTVRSDPEVLELLSGAGLAIEPVEAALKGFDEERFELWRVRRG